MRALLAIMIAIGGIAWSQSTADARQYRRSAKPPYYFSSPPLSPSLREQALCEERARNSDPAGRYAGYPCWAREVFSRQPR